MNSILILLIFAHLAASTWAAAADPLFVENHRRYAGECKKELNANDADSAILKTFDVPQNDVQRCLVDCLYSKLGVIKDGKLSNEGQQTISKAIAGNDKEKLSKMDEIFQTCSKEVEKLTNQTCNIGKTMRSCVETKFPAFVPTYKGATATKTN